MRTVTEVPGSDTPRETVTQYGLLKSSRDETGIEITFGYDALGRRTTTTHPRTGTTEISYNSNNQVEWVTDPSNRTTSFTYDPASGRKMSQTDPMSRTTRYRYNDMGRITHTWGAGYPVQYQYDGLNRMTHMHTYKTREGWHSTVWPQANDAQADVTQWHYDPPTGLLAAKEDAKGHMTLYTYGDQNRLAARTWARQVNGQPLVTTYGYNTAGDLESVDYSDATPDLAFTCNRLGTHHTVTDALGTGSATAVSYEPDRNLKSKVLNTRGRTVISRYGHTHDDLGRRQTRNVPASVRQRCFFMRQLS